MVDGSIELVEVKGNESTSLLFELTPNEWRAARAKDNFIVIHLSGGFNAPVLRRYTRIRERLRRGVVQVRSWQIDGAQLAHQEIPIVSVAGLDNEAEG